MTHVRIIGAPHLGKERHEAFKRRRKQRDFLLWNDYADKIVSSFAHQIKSEHYCGNRYLFIEGISLDNLCASNQSSS